MLTKYSAPDYLFIVGLSDGIICDHVSPNECYVAGHDFASHHLKGKYSENNFFYIKANLYMELSSIHLLYMITCTLKSYIWRHYKQVVLIRFY